MDLTGGSTTGAQATSGGYLSHELALPPCTPSLDPQVMRTIRHLSAVLVLAMTTLLCSPTSAFALAPVRTMTSCSPGVPEKDGRTAEYVYEFAVPHNYAAPPGLKRNSRYHNDNGLLPPASTVATARPEAPKDR